ncbi:glycosyltransferase family 2 protein [Verrucomicrobium spinosum]|uniref:glycosyltransferase family 2 protein n=2 Tax=Verrucomicrobium spinosum TaxID=2736 RepID=UPI00210A1330|nr:glycosyltransferase [Verrucomicrobium spinosum]
MLIRYAQSAETLPGVLASLDRQTRKPDQILGVDSAGCAACGELIRQSGGVVLRWMHEYEHSRVLNFGLQHLHTDYVLVLSSHTVLDDPCVLERMTAAMEDPTVACVSGKWDEDTFYSDSIDLGEVREKGLKFGSIYSNSMGMIRRNLWEKCPFDESLPTAEDYAWALQQLAAGFICRRLEFPFSYVRNGPRRERLFAQVTFQLAAMHHLKPAWPGGWSTFKCLAGACLHPGRPGASALKLVMRERLQAGSLFNYLRRLAPGFPPVNVPLANHHAMRIHHNVIALLFFASTVLAVSAQVSTNLTDKIHRGSGTINLLKDITGDQLAKQVTSSGSLLLGVDVNEDAAGNESNASVGVALKSAQLVVVTSKGTYVFTNYSTNTSAVLIPAGGSTLQSYQTLIGQGGSSQITGATQGFDLSHFDDVLSFNRIAFEGQVLAARIEVQFLDTGNSKSANDAFFDFSGGFEDFALLSARDALALENANIGWSALPSSVASTSSAPVISESVVNATEAAAVGSSASPLPPTSDSTAAAPGGAPMLPAPAAPAPPAMVLIAALGLIALTVWSRARSQLAGNTMN